MSEFDFYKSTDEYQKAEKWIEKTYGVALDNLERLREYASKAQHAFVVPHFSNVIHNARETKNINELETSIEKFYRRSSVVGTALWLCNEDNVKKRAELKCMEWVYFILQHRVFLPEMLYVMQIKKLHKNANFDETLNNIHKYWTWMCEVYLDKTEVYEQMLDDYFNGLEK